MNTDKHEEIYSWLESRSFQQLDSKEQNLVHTIMSAQDYDEMHQAVLAMQGKKSNPNIRGKEAVWQSIEQELKEVKKIRFAWLSYQVPATWAVAVLIFLLALVLYPRFTQEEDKLAMKPKTVHDTVYVEIPVLEKELIYDTVYQDRFIEVRKRMVKQELISNTVPSLETDLHIQSAKEGKEPINNPKNNSMQYDSMLNKIGFVCL